MTKTLTLADLDQAARKGKQYQWMRDTVRDILLKPEHDGKPTVGLKIKGQYHNGDEFLMGAVKGVIVTEYQSRMRAIRTELEAMGIALEDQDPIDGF